MARFQVLNNYSTTLASSVTSGATSMDVTDASRIPASVSSTRPLALTLAPPNEPSPDLSQLEIVYVTAKNGSTLSIERGKDGTSAKDWSSGDPVEGRLPAAIIEQFLQIASFGEQVAANANVDSGGVWLTTVPGSGRGPTAAGAVVLGDYGLVSAPNSVAAGGVGNEIEAAATSAHVEGLYNVVKQPYGHAEGWYTIAEGKAAHAEGRNTTASAPYSHAEGHSTTAYGSAYAAHVEGHSSTAEGVYSHAEGYSTTAGGKAAHSEGVGTTAPGDYSHAEGNVTAASGLAAHAEGYKTKALAAYGHAEGYYTAVADSATAARAGGNYSNALQKWADVQGAGAVYGTAGTPFPNPQQAIRQPISGYTSGDNTTYLSPGIELTIGGYPAPYTYGSWHHLRGIVGATDRSYAAFWRLEAKVFVSNSGASLVDSSDSREYSTGGAASAWGISFAINNYTLYIEGTGDTGDSVWWTGVVYGVQQFHFYVPESPR